MSEKPEAWAVERACDLLNAHPAKPFFVTDGDLGALYGAVEVIANLVQAHEQPPEPDWEAWRPALEKFYDRNGAASNPLDESDKHLVLRLIAASKVMPKGDVA